MASVIVLRCDESEAEWTGSCFSKYQSRCWEKCWKGCVRDRLQGYDPQIEAISCSTWPRKPVAISRAIARLESRACPTKMWDYEDTSRMAWQEYAKQRAASDRSGKPQHFPTSRPSLQWHLWTVVPEDCWVSGRHS